MLLPQPLQVCCVTHFSCHAHAAAGVTALVFGREESGLTEAELRLCAQACAIPTGRMQGSMNLSHAVAVVLSGLFERRLALLGYTDNPGLDLKGDSLYTMATQMTQPIFSGMDCAACLWCL